MESATYADMSREQLIDDLKSFGLKLDDNELSWVELCKFTEFDSFMTALAFGLHWNEGDEGANKLDVIDMAKLRMAHYNITNFPKKGIGDE